MNILHTLPITILPFASESEQAGILERLTHYFQANPLAARVARKRDHTQKLVEIAAHSRQLWCLKWVNPRNGKWLLVVADKASMPSSDALSSTLKQEAVRTTLELWTK